MPQDRPEDQHQSGADSEQCDDIPMTGEEDPLAEVDQTDSFDRSVAEFTASERKARLNPSHVDGVPGLSEDEGKV